MPNSSTSKEKCQKHEYIPFRNKFSEVPQISNDKIMRLILVKRVNRLVMPVGSRWSSPRNR